MNHKEADLIIKNYKPYKGFYDLSKKPASLTKIEYAKVLRLQGFIVSQVKNVEYLKKHCLIGYQKVVELSAKYQFIIREHWGWDEL